MVGLVSIMVEKSTFNGDQAGDQRVNMTGRHRPNNLEGVLVVVSNLIVVACNQVLFFSSRNSSMTSFITSGIPFANGVMQVHVDACHFLGVGSDGVPESP